MIRLEIVFLFFKRECENCHTKFLSCNNCTKKQLFIRCNTCPKVDIQAEVKKIFNHRMLSKVFIYNFIIYARFFISYYYLIKYFYFFPKENTIEKLCYLVLFIAYGIYYFINLVIYYNFLKFFIRTFKAILKDFSPTDVINDPFITKIKKAHKKQLENQELKKESSFFTQYNKLFDYVFYISFYTKLLWTVYSTKNIFSLTSLEYSIIICDIIIKCLL